MPADQIKKTKVFERNFECQIMDKKNAIRSESIVNQNTIRVYTDGSKLDGRVGAGFYAEYPNNSPKQTFFQLGIGSTVSPAEVLAISEVAKNLLLEKRTKSDGYQSAYEVHCSINCSAQLHSNSKSAR